MEEKYIFSFWNTKNIPRISLLSNSDKYSRIGS